MSLNIQPTTLEGVKLVTPPFVFDDFRGVNIETWNKDEWAGLPPTPPFVQDSVSISSKHVLRGIHGDTKTWKLVTCLRGTIYLVVAERREPCACPCHASPGNPHHPLNCECANRPRAKWEAFTLSDKNRLQVLIPPGFGNGHLVMSDEAIFHYKLSAYTDTASQFSLRWNDPSLGIWWPVVNPIVSKRDAGEDICPVYGTRHHVVEGFCACVGGKRP